MLILDPHTGSKVAGHLLLVQKAGLKTLILTVPDGMLSVFSAIRPLLLDGVERSLRKPLIAGWVIAVAVTHDQISPAIPEGGASFNWTLEIRACP
jgi:hypothetical protein